MIRYKKTLSDYGVDALIYLVLLFISLATLYPFYYIFIGSFSPITDLISTKLLLWPSSIDLNAYRTVLSNRLIPQAYKVTIFVTIVGTTLNMVFTIMGAYVLSKKFLPGRSAMTLMIVITMLFNGGLIPTFLTVKSIGLYDNVWALVIPGLISTYNMIVLRNFFMQIPSSLEESATIDGCSYTGTLVKIILPLSLPALATISLFYAVGNWNSFFNAVIYINKQDLWPLQLLLREMLLKSTNDMLRDNNLPPTETVKMAMIIVVVFPILIVYPFLQKYFVKGMLVGSVKG